MLSAVQIKPDVYWVGAIDWNEREFHGYTTEAGITYNAYLILDERVTLIDNVKPTFRDELMQRIASIIDPSKIEVVIANHVEMDHSGCLGAIREIAPECEIYASAPQGVRGLTAHHGDLGVKGVKTGDEISIGRRTLRFVQTPMVHWPDNMVTYCPEDSILFSNDCFGQHYATSARFDDECDVHEVFHQARKYYANIVQPYVQQAQAAMKAIRGLGQIDVIAPAHGVCWRGHVEEILREYEEVYASGAVQERALVVYDSMWHATDEMAHAILDGFMAKGIPARLIDLKATHVSDIMNHFLDTKYLCVGSPTLNSQMLPTMSAFLTYLQGLSPKNENRVAMAFGAYGWAPLGPKSVQTKLEEMQFRMPEPVFAVNWTPTPEQIDELRSKVDSLLEA